jgi:hypothetical protein
MGGGAARPDTKRRSPAPIGVNTTPVTTINAASPLNADSLVDNQVMALLNISTGLPPRCFIGESPGA